MARLTDTQVATAAVLFAAFCIFLPCALRGLGVI